MSWGYGGGYGEDRNDIVADNMRRIKELIYGTGEDSPASPGATEEPGDRKRRA